MFEKLITLHDDILPQIFWGSYHILWIASDRKSVV
jgi:hypothetical protein